MPTVPRRTMETGGQKGWLWEEAPRDFVGARAGAPVERGCAADRIGRPTWPSGCV